MGFITEVTLDITNFSTAVKLTYGDVAKREEVLCQHHFQTLVHREIGEPSIVPIVPVEFLTTDQLKLKGGSFYFHLQPVWKIEAAGIEESCHTCVARG